MSKPRKWNEKDLCKAVIQSKSIRQVIKKLKLQPAGGNYAQIQKYLEFYKINTSHFTGQAWNKGLKGIGNPRISLSEVLIKDSNFQSYKLKQRLFKEKIKEPRCEECGWAQISKDGHLPLELDHINGNRKDNRLKNLRILCPNCHSLKSTHRGKT